jgi:hypothetical protein
MHPILLGGLSSAETFDFARGVYDEGFDGGARARQTREVLFDKPDKLFVVRDQLAALDDREHLCEALWHLDTPRLLREPQKGIYETQIKNGGNLRMVTQMGEGLECRVVEGQEKPVVQGWLPTEIPSRGVRPIPCIICGRSGKYVEFCTLFQPLKTGDERRVNEVRFHAGSVEVTWSDSRKTTLLWPK